MKKQKGFSAILILPLVVLVLAVVGVFAYKLYSDGVKAKAQEEQQSTIIKTNPSLQGAPVKPVKGYGGMQGATRAASPSATPTKEATSTVSGTPLEALLEESDDAGEAELKVLDATASANL